MSNHLNLKVKYKMKVKYTVHILSATVAAALQNIIRCKYFISSCIYSRIY